MQLVARVARKGFVAGEDRNFVCWSFLDKEA